MISTCVSQRNPPMLHAPLAGIKLVVSAFLMYAAHFAVSRSNFDYLYIPNIFLLVGLALFFEAALSLICSISKELDTRRTGLIVSSRSTFIALFLADSAIRLTGVVQTYSERADGNYFSLARREQLTSWYWVHTPNTVIRNQRKEFIFSREVNSLGLSEREIETKKGSHLRILAIGDSFTEGVGVSYEDTWVKQMETRWKEHKVQTINAGIGGSDPVFAFALYRDKLTAYKPDIVILTINSTDITEITGRGGFDRFHEDGTVGKDAPSWEWIYAASHSFRVIMHGAFNYNSSLTRNARTPDAEENAVKIIKETVERFRDLAERENADLVIALQPSLQEFDNGLHTPFPGQLELARFLAAEGISYVDASIEFKRLGNTVPDYYWPLDTHFNLKGYALFGKTVYQKVEALKLLDSRATPEA